MAELEGPREVGASVKVHGAPGIVDQVDPDGTVHVTLESGVGVRIAEDKSWPPSGIETKTTPRA